MTVYRLEQLACHRLVHSAVEGMPASERGRLLEEIQPYLDFRRAVEAFQEARFADVCSAACFQSRLSACCTKDGVLTFFADHAIDGLMSDSGERRRLLENLSAAQDGGFKCVYLGPEGCGWKLKPLICAMFLCQPAMDRVFAEDPQARETWNGLTAEALAFRWPDRPVLFDRLEARFMAIGLDSPLMHCHKSPGLLRVKRRAGLI